jgi:ubiquinone biosynthesis protein Coq4
MESGVFKHERGVTGMKATVKFEQTIEQEKEVELPFYFRWFDKIFKQFISHRIRLSSDSLFCHVERRSFEDTFNDMTFADEAIASIDKQPELKKEFDSRYTEFKKNVEGLE